MMNKREAKWWALGCGWAAYLGLAGPALVSAASTEAALLGAATGLVLVRYTYSQLKPIIQSIKERSNENA